MSTLSDFDFYQLPLDAILNIKDRTLKLELLNEYKENLNAFQVLGKGTHKLVNDVIGQYVDFQVGGPSIASMLDILEDASLQNISHLYLNGDYVLVYALEKEQKARKPYTCLFTGAQIMPGKKYRQLKYMVIDKTQNQRYVTDPIHYQSCPSNFDFPETIRELEDFQRVISGDYTPYDYPIDVSNLRSSLPGGLLLRKIRNYRKGIK